MYIQIALLRACFGCNNSQKQAWKVYTILTPATGRCFLRCFATRYAPKMVHVSTPMTPGFNHEKWGNQGTNPRHFVNRSWKKWWFRRRFAFLYGIAYMILGPMNLCTVFFGFGRIKMCDGLSQVHLISWTRRRNSKFPMVFQSNCCMCCEMYPKGTTEENSSKLFRLWPFGVFFSWPFQRWIVTSGLVIKRSLRRSWLVDFLASCFRL